MPVTNVAKEIYRLAMRDGHDTEDFSAIYEFTMGGNEKSKGITPHMIKTISYLGLGTMGSGMASNLLKAGYKLTVWNRNAEKCEPFARKGARVADTPADAVRDVELVMY